MTGHDVGVLPEAARERHATPVNDRFARNHAFIIGINAYRNVSPLRTAVNDALALAELLSVQQHFLVHPPLLDATAADIRDLLHNGLREVQAGDRLLFYFAGHGIAADGEDGPAGYIVPADAIPTDTRTFIAMDALQEALDALPCRHLLLILDCCFSGAFKWSSQHRALLGTLVPRRIYRERFDRFIEDPAWQVITSAAYDQKALDVLEGTATGDRGLATVAGDRLHSPFALALFDGLAGMADARVGSEGDGIITATELYSFIRDTLEPQTLQSGERHRQTPGFFPLRKHDKGEFIFSHPEHRLNLPRLPDRCPYKGLAAFEEADELLFYGRDDVIATLQATIGEHRLVVVSGASGTGKSSLVKAGLLPRLRKDGLTILPVIRPGEHPLRELDRVARALADAADPAARTVLLVDQCEELITRCADAGERTAFMARLREMLVGEHPVHRLLITVRSDFEPQLQQGSLQDMWRAGRIVVPPFSLEQLREVILLPTMQEVLVFEPPDVVDDIIGEVVQAPGALPLLSYALSELYEAYRSSGRADRALLQADYERLGGVTGALRASADRLYESLEPAARDVLRKLMLRMVTVEGELAGRRVRIADLDYSAEQNPHVHAVIERLVDARLVVKGEDYVEPAHDALVRAWRTLHDWIHQVGRDALILAHRLSADAAEYARSEQSTYLWNDNPNLAVALSQLETPSHIFNAREVAFVRRSAARNRRNARITWGLALATGLALLALSMWALRERATAEASREDAEAARDRAEQQRTLAERSRTAALDAGNRTLLSLFSGLRLSMQQGQPGSVCVHGLCEGAPAAATDGAADGKWLSLGRLPDSMDSLMGAPISRDFAALRQFGAGHVLIYAHDGLASDFEINEADDNLTFTQNALAWLVPLARGGECTEQPTTILLWEGTYVGAEDMSEILRMINRRGWRWQHTAAATLEADLRCADVLWYLSDWDPPPGFAARDVPAIESFVRKGGGLLVGGLGWSYEQQGGPGGSPAITPYAANELGRAFGFAFTPDAFGARDDAPIELAPGTVK